MTQPEEKKIKFTVIFYINYYYHMLGSALNQMYIMVESDGKRWHFKLLIIIALRNDVLAVFVFL